mmetsp:Transcript_12092/g.37440  ORF Transcript_12092/g.37440 Transcript_12092/m.37440 type:complete len:252 (+) Transcript_12092:133-888(+)
MVKARKFPWQRQGLPPSATSSPALCSARPMRAVDIHATALRTQLLACKRHCRRTCRCRECRRPTCRRCPCSGRASRSHVAENRAWAASGMPASLARNYHQVPATRVPCGAELRRQPAQHHQRPPRRQQHRRDSVQARTAWGLVGTPPRQRRGRQEIPRDPASWPSRQDPLRPPPCRRRPARAASGAPTGPLQVQGGRRPGEGRRAPATGARCGPGRRRSWCGTSPRGTPRTSSWTSGGWWATSTSSSCPAT